MSQPAMSLAIARFRQVTGDALFENTGRGVKPTPRALQLAGPVRRALDLVSGALGQGNEFNPSDCERTFNLALGDSGEILMLPRLMEFLHELCSPIRVRTLSAAGLDLAKEMRSGNVDLHGWIEPFEMKEFNSQQIGTLEEVCLVRTGHPEVKDKLTLEQYAALKHIVYQLPSSYGPSSVDRKLWSRGLKREHTMSVHTYFDVPRILSVTDMICSMPVTLARRFAEVYPLKIVPLPMTRELPVFLIWHRNMESDPGHRWLREYLIGLHSRV